MEQAKFNSNYTNSEQTIYPKQHNILHIIKDLRPANTITLQCVHMRTYTIPKTYLDKLKQDYKNFTLVSFDKW